MGFIDDLKNIGAGSEGSYLKLNFGKNKAEFGEAVRSTYSLLKQNPEYSWETEGTSANVTNAVLSSMNDPNQYMIMDDRKIMFPTGVGKLQAYNEMGNPSGGCWTYHMIG